MADGSTKVVITGVGAICAAGESPDAIWEAVRAGRSAIAPIQQWDASRVSAPPAGEIANLDPRELVADRKVHKLLRRTDFLGLYVAGKAIAAAGLATHRETLDADAAALFNDRTGVFVGSGRGGPSKSTSPRSKTRRCR